MLIKTLIKPSFKWPKKRSLNPLKQNRPLGRLPLQSRRQAKVKSINMFMISVKKLTETQSNANFGRKGANLAEMAKIGLPVPPGLQFQPRFALIFIKIKSLIQSIDDQIRASVALMEKQLGQKLGDLKKPLLFRLDQVHGIPCQG